MSDKSGFDILASLLGSAQDFEGLGESVRPNVAALEEEERAGLERLIYPDVFSEYDARHLSAHVRTLDVHLGEHFWACEEHWADDEELHYLGFRSIYAPLSGRTQADIRDEMNARRSSFAPIAHLFADEFRIACLMAYDELATVRAYRSGHRRYARLGPEVLAFVQLVTADEGRHYRNFVKLLRQEHAHRLHEVGDVIAEIRATEGTSYGNTFVLDHDDDVWSESIFDDAARSLTTRLST